MSDENTFNKEPDGAAEINKRRPVPDIPDTVKHNWTTAEEDSPESLDQEISEGANREDIDPDHSIIRPAGVKEIERKYIDEPDEMQGV